jgi:hypothetical protein
MTTGMSFLKFQLWAVSTQRVFQLEKATRPYQEAFSKNQEIDLSLRNLKSRASRQLALITISNRAVSHRELLQTK